MVCPVCKHDNSDDVKFCTNCNTFLHNETHKPKESSKVVVSNNNSDYVSKPVKNSVYLIISFVCSIISAIGVLLIPFTLKLSTIFLLFTGKLFKTFVVSNSAFIICSVLAVLFGSTHRSRYNYRCTGYIIGIITSIVYILVFLGFLCIYIKVKLF